MSTNNPVSEQEVIRIRQGLTDLGDAIFRLSTQEPPKPEIQDRELSGNKIHGGKITAFQSVGIKDASTRLVVLVNDDGIVTDNIDVETLVGDTTVTGDLNVEGHVKARSLHVDELTADVRQERSSPLEFVADKDNSVYGKGLLFRGEGGTKQFILRANPDRFFVSESLDLHREAHYAIDGLAVLTSDELGVGVVKSNLRKVGTLENLRVQGNFTLDNYIFWNSDYMRLGVGTETPNGMIGLVQEGAELVLNLENEVARVGTFTTSTLELITDDTARITVGATGKITIGSSSDSKITVNGKLGINVNNPDADIVTSGPVKFEGKRFEVGSAIPVSGVYNKGDIVWNSDPKPTGFVGWICTREGNPGMWKSFGQIAN